MGGKLRKLTVPALLAALSFVVFELSAGADRGDASAGARVIAYASGTVGWLALAWASARLVDLLLQRAAATLRPAQAPRLLNDLLRAAIFALALIAILVFVFQQAATGLIATSSVAIAVIGFALRYIIADVFSGIVLNFDHPYRIGDWIEPGPGMLGRVAEITWRTTRLVTRDGTTVVLPNGLVATGRLLNFSAPAPSFRTSLRFWIDARLPIERVKKVLLAGAYIAQRLYPDLRPDVLVQDCGESGVLYVVRFWVPDAGEENTCRDAVVAALVEILQRHGIGFAAPHRTLAFAHEEAPLPSLATPSAHELIERCDLFGAFTEEERAELSRHLVGERIKQGDAVFRRDAPGGSLYLVAEGALEVRAPAPDGREIVIDRMVAGDLFGEISLLTGEARSASVVALSDALLYQLTKADIEPFLWRRTELFDTLAKLMVERQRRNRNRLLHFAKPADPDVGADDLLRRIRSFFGLSRRAS